MKPHNFFRNDKCRYFPCHDVSDSENFNCLFCYCPLYPLGDKCGGNFRYNKNGVKSCVLCDIPHTKESYVMSRINEVIELCRKK